jgi:hypothetical protein
MKTLVIDIGGSNIKILATGIEERVKISSGKKLGPEEMVSEVKAATADWSYGRISMGYPGPVVDGAPISDPVNLGKGWVGFDFEKAFGCPVKVINDAALQALGSYSGGRMLFLGIGTGLGTAIIIDGVIQPMELAHLPYKKGTLEDTAGKRGLGKLGKKKWRTQVTKIVGMLKEATQTDYVVLGGGNAKLLKKLPKDAVLGDNNNAFEGGFRLWATTPVTKKKTATKKVSKKKTVVRKKTAVKKKTVAKKKTVVKKKLLKKLGD